MGAEEFVPDDTSLGSLREAAAACLSTPLGVPAVATVHPSSILRAPDEKSRDEAMAGFIQDLRAAKRHLGESAH